LVVIAIFIGIGSFFLSESVGPITSSVANTIWKTQVEKKDTQGSYKLSHLFTLHKRIDARKAKWVKGIWYLNDGLIQKIAPDGSRKTVRFRNHTIQLPETPHVFERTMKAPEEMSFWELKRYTRKIREEGYDSTRCQVELHNKIAFPFISLVLTLIGIPLGLRKKKGGISGPIRGLAPSFRCMACKPSFFTLRDLSYTGRRKLRKDMNAKSLDL
jgi:lipopolysaccharide export system permease protein